MARSPLLGIDRPNPHAPGHDDLALGPSDSSDSGSDLAGLDAPDRADPDLPLDRALADDVDHPLGAPDARGNASDTAGTGERRSAAGDAGGPDGADIAVDRVFSPFGEGDGDDDLPPVEELAVDDGEAEDEEAGEEGADAPADAPSPARGAARARRDAEEDEAADPVGDGAADAAQAARMAHVPGRPNPEPDPPDDAPLNPAPADEPPSGDEPHKHQPGRDPGARRQG